MDWTPACLVVDVLILLWLIVGDELKSKFMNWRWKRLVDREAARLESANAAINLAIEERNR